MTEPSPDGEPLESAARSGSEKPAEVSLAERATATKGGGSPKSKRNARYSRLDVDVV